MIFTWAMLVCSKDFRFFFSRFWSWILINLWYDLKASTLVRAPNPWARCVCDLFLWHFLSSIEWTVGNLYLSMSSISNHPNTTKIHCKCPCQRSGLSDHESQAKNPSEGRSPLEKTNMKWKTRRLQNISAVSRWFEVESVFIESREGAVR